MDQAIVHYLNQVAAASPPLSGAVIFFAQYLPYLVAALFALFVIFRVLPQREKWLLLGAGFGAGALARGAVELIRVFVERPRPFVTDETIVALLNETSYSFPSGHAAFFFALSTVVYLHARQGGLARSSFAEQKLLGWWFFIASALIGLARIAAGAHYPTDVLAGALLGIAVGYSVARWLKTHRTVSGT